jgi:hypothetical protein
VPAGETAVDCDTAAVAHRPPRCLNRRVHARRTRPVDRLHSTQTDPRGGTGLVKPPERAALWLQRTAGNQAAAGLLARDADTGPKDAPMPGEARAKKLAALLPGKRADVLGELEKATEAERQSVDEAAAKLGTTKNAKARVAMLLLRRCIAFVRHRPGAPSKKPGPGVKKGKEGEVKLDAKVDGGEITLRTGVDAGLGRPAFSLTYHGANADDCHWLQFIRREIVPWHEGGSAGEKVEEPSVAGRVERSAGFSYNLTTKQDAPEWNTDSADKQSAFYEEGTGAVKRSADELAMFDDPDPRDNLLIDAFKAKGTALPAHAVSRAHFETYLVRGMDILYRVKLDLSWQITNGKADAAPEIIFSGEAIGGIQASQLAKLKEQLGSSAQMPDYLATAEAKATKPATKPATKAPSSKPAVQRDTGAFDTVKDLSPKGSLPASEWDPKTRTVGASELLAEIATLAGAGKIEGVKGTAKGDINAILRKDSALQAGLNFVAGLGDNGETGFIDSAKTYRGAKLPVDDGGIPSVAIMLGPSAFAHGKAHALATMRHEMKHAEHYLLAVHALKRWRDGKRDKTFDAWVMAEEREPDRTLIRERIAGTLPNTELLAYTEGLVASFHFIPQAPDPKLMVPGSYPVAIFELMKAGAEYQASTPQVATAAFDRLRAYCRDTLSAAQRGALVAWIDYLLAYVSAKEVPPQHKGADPRFAKGIMDEVKNLGPFLKKVREIAAKPDAK